MAEAAHSKFSASAAHRWMQCPGSMVLSVGRVDKGSKYAAWGTVAHGIADNTLSEGATHVEESIWRDSSHDVDGHTIVVDQDMVDCVNTYITNVREMTAGAELFQSETRTNYATWLAVPVDQAWGTADATAVRGTELQVHDLKTGQGVEVDAKDNEQLMLYAGGKLSEIEELGLDIETIRLVIHQPRIRKAPSEWSITRDELVKWLLGPARSAANSVRVAEDSPPTGTEWEKVFLNTGDGCKFCKAKATCPKLRGEVIGTVFETSAPTPDDFEDVKGVDADIIRTERSSDREWIATCLSKVDLIEEWCSAVRAEAFRRLEAGEQVPGFKLVQGKRGARQWANPTEAEAMLKTFHLKVGEMYDLKLISPTSAEKLHKAETIGKRQWPKLQTLITQSEGKPSVAPASDPRPAIDVRPIEEAFEPVADDIC